MALPAGWAVEGQAARLPEAEGVLHSHGGRVPAELTHWRVTRHCWFWLLKSVSRSEMVENFKTGVGVWNQGGLSPALGDHEAVSGKPRAARGQEAPDVKNS